MKKLFVFLILFLGLFFADYIVYDQGTNARVNSSLITLGNLTIQFYDAASSGTLLWEQNFTDQIVNGSWSVKLNLSTFSSGPYYGETYYKEYQINRVELNYSNGSATTDRLAWVSTVGQVNKTKINAEFPWTNNSQYTYINSGYPNSLFSQGILNISNNGVVAIGNNSRASGLYAIGLGGSANATGDYSLALGYNSTSNDVGDISIGINAYSDLSAVAIGINSNASNQSYAIGDGANASGQFSMALGKYANCSGRRAISIGMESISQGEFATSVGDSSFSIGTESIAVGYQAISNGTSAIAVGSGAIANASDVIALGHSSISNGSHSISIGYTANTSGSNAIAIGTGARAGSDSSIAIGQASANDTYAIAIGWGAASRHEGAVAVGYASQTEEDYQVAIRGSDIKLYPQIGSDLNLTLHDLPAVSGGEAILKIDTASKEVKLDTSSIRYKINVSTLSDSSKILNLNPVSFNWKSSGKRDVGLIAEEVAAVEPILVTYDASGSVQGVQYDKLSVYMLNIIKEQQEKIDSQERELSALKELVCLDHPEADVCK